MLEKIRYVWEGYNRIAILWAGRKKTQYLLFCKEKIWLIA